MCTIYCLIILIIDGETDDINLREDIYGNRKWSRIAQYGTKLFCIPALYNRIGVLEDQTLKLKIDQMENNTLPESEDKRCSILVDHVRDGSIEDLEELLDSGVCSNSVKDGVTALQAAVHEGHQEAVELLLKHKASAVDILCIVDIAVKLGHVKIAKTLCKSGVSYSRLVDHAKNGNTKEMENLLTEWHVNPNSSDVE